MLQTAYVPTVSRERDMKKIGCVLPIRPLRPRVYRFTRPPFLMSDRVLCFHNRVRSAGIVIGSGDGDLVQLLGDALVHGDEHDLVRLRSARVVDLRERLRDGRDRERVSASADERCV